MVDEQNFEIHDIIFGLRSRIKSCAGETFPLASPAMAESRHAFIALDGLRGIAAFAVAFVHCLSWGPPQFYLAVDFFFVLSGFVLAHAYGERLRKGMTTRRFMALRLKRLYPLYLLSLALWLPVGLRELQTGMLDPGTATVVVITAILFLPAPAPTLTYPINISAWSLFYELLANACYGLIARLDPRAVILIAAAGAIALITSVTANGGMENDDFSIIFYIGAARVAYSFFAGVVLYRLWLKRKPSLSLPAPIAALVLIVILCIPIGGPYRAAFDLLAALLLFPLLIWFSAGSKPPPLIARLCTWSGTISYGLYILHVPAMTLAVKVAAHL